MKTRHLLFVSTLFACATASAGTFTWTNLSGGSFATAGNWSAAPTFAADDVLDFSTLNITAGRTLTLDGNRIAGTLKFGDATTASNDWTVSPGTPSTSKITLSTTSGTPVINVVNQTTNFGVVIDGTQGFEKTGAGNFALTGSNTYTGITTLTTGQIYIQNPTALGSSAAGSGTTLTAGSQIYLLGGGQTAPILEEFLVTGAATFRAGNGVVFSLGGRTTLDAGVTFNVDSGATINHSGASGVIEGTGAVTKSGPGTLVLSGSNTYSGATGVTAGVLKLAKSASLNQYTNVTVSSGATLAFITGDGSTGWSQAQIDSVRGTSGFTLSSGSLLGFDTGTNGDFTYATSITGSPAYGLSKIGAGALTLSGFNTHTGGTALVAGTLNINDNSALGTGTLTITKNALIANTSGLPVSVSNNILGANLTLIGDGDLSTSGTATYTSDRSIFVNGTGVLTVGSIAGSASLVLVKQGPGTLVITGAAGANVNGVDIRAGTLIIGNKSALGANAFRFNNTAGGVLQTSVHLTGANKVANPVDVGVAGNISGLFDLELGGVISGSAALAKFDGGALVISGGANTYSGNLTVFEGTLKLANQLALQGGTVTMNGGNLVFDSSVAGNAFTLGALAASGSGSGYDIALQNNAGSPAPIALTIGGNNAGTTYAGELSGAGSLTKVGSGTFTLSGASTFSGGTAVRVGVVKASANSAFGSGDVTLGVSGSTSQIQLDGGVDVTNKLIINSNNGISGNGILRVDVLDGFATWSGPIEVNATPVAGSHFMTGNNATLTLLGYITAAPGLPNLGQRNGNVIYSGGGNYTNFILFQGLSKIGSNNGMSTAAVMNVGSSGPATLDLNGFNQTYDGVISSIPATSIVTNSALTPSVLTLGAATDRTYGGIIDNGTGGISLVKQGASKLTLSGLNSYAGNTTVTSGILEVTNNNVLSDTGTVNLLNSGSLNLTHSGTDVVGGLVIGGFSQPNGLYTFGTGKLQVVSAVTDYGTWVSFYSLQNPWSGVDPLLNGEPTADPDKDGLSNQKEYAFGLSPVSGASINPIIVNLNKTTGTFTYQRRSTTGLTYKVWTSTNLSTWTLDTGASAPVITPAGSNETVAFTLTGIKPLTAPALFVRVTAE